MNKNDIFTGKFIKKISTWHTYTMEFTINSF